MTRTLKRVWTERSCGDPHGDVRPGARDVGRTAPGSVGRFRRAVEMPLMPGRQDECWVGGWVRVDAVLDVVIPTRGRVGLVMRCLERLAEQPQPERLHVIVVDDGSEDTTLATLDAYRPPMR